MTEILNRLVTTVYAFARRGKGQAGQTYDAAVFGIRENDDSPLTYEHLPKDLNSSEVFSALADFNIDFCHAAIIGADVILKQNASGGGIRNIIKARLLNAGIGNALPEKQRGTEINGLVEMIYRMSVAMGVSWSDAYDIGTARLKPELVPVVIPTEPTEPTTESDDHADLDSDLSVN